jgi:hypothetical protein
MKRINKILLLISILTLIATSVTLNLTIHQVAASIPEEPHDADAMWVEPSLVNATGRSIGDKFNVTVWLNVTVDCGCWQFKLIYNKNYLNITRCVYTGTGGSKSQFFENTGTTTFPTTPSFGTYNETHNYVLHGESWMGGPFGTGVGSLSCVEFEIMAEPSEGEEIFTIVDISSLYPIDTYIRDEEFEKPPLNVGDCIYTFKSPTAPPPPPEETRIYVDPPEIIDPTMLPSSTFSINITVDDVADLQICEFNLTYNSIIISWTSMAALKVQNQTPSVTSMIDNEAGFIWVKLRYSSAFSTDTPTPLLTIEFYVASLGATPLDLHDTQLLNSESQPIEHEAIDGFFCTLIRDVAITHITVSRNWVYQGWKTNITVTAKNKGNISETFAVQAFFGNNSIENITIMDLPPNNETTVTFVWDTENVTACVNYTISAEASTVPYELNTTDNKLTDGKIKVRYLGDVNGDNKIDIEDIYTIAMAFGSYPPSPRWNPDFDLDQNLKIDISDIYLIAINFGKVCPP